MNGRRQIDLTKNVLKSSLYQSPSVVMQTSTTQAFNNTKLTTEPKSEQGIKKKVILFKPHRATGGTQLKLIFVK